MWKYVKGVFFSIEGLQKGYVPVCQNGEQKGKGFDLNIVEYPHRILSMAYSLLSLQAREDAKGCVASCV